MKSYSAGSGRNHPHPNCIICGTDNPWSLGLTFSPDSAGKIRAVFKGREELQGYDGIMHGGIIAALLDSTMTNCLFRSGIRALTGELNIRYKKPIPAKAEIELIAEIISEKPPLYIIEAVINCDSRLMAKASAKFIRITEG